MPRTQQDILVKIKVLLEGLGNVRALAGHIKELNSGGGGQVAALTGDLNKLSAAVDRLAAAQEKAGKGGFLRFLVGASAVVNILATLPQAFNGLNKLLDFLDDIGGGVAAAFGKVKEFFSSLFSSLSQLAGGVTSRAGAAVSGLGGAVSGLGAALGAALPFVLAVGAALALVVAALASAALGFIGLAVAAGLGGVALLKVAQVGLGVQRQLEQVRLGIAAIITSLADVKVDGAPVEGAEKFRVALELADAQLKKLQVDAINTTATFGQIAPAFQAAIGPGLAAGLNLDQIRGLTVQIVQAATALNIPLNQVSQEVRAILEGTINEDARLAKVLGISNEMVKSWKAQGKLAEELNKRLEGFSTAGVEAAQTLDGLTSNLEEALNVFSAEATGRAFGTLKAEFARLLPQLFDFKQAGIQDEFKSLARLADDVLVRVIRIAGGVAQDIVAGLRRASAFVEQNRGLIGDVLNIAGLLFRQIREIVGVVVRLATDTGVWRGALDSVRGVLLLISVVLQVVIDKLREAAPLLRLAALAATLLIQSNSSLAALASSGGGADGRTEAQRALDNLAEEKARLSPEELRRRGFTPDISLSAGGGGGAGKGGGGGGGRQSQVRQLTRALEEAQVETSLARLRVKADLIKQEIEAGVEAVRNGLEDATISISEAFRLESALADRYLEAERERIREELAAAEKRRNIAVANLDPDLTAEERRLAIAAEEEKLAAETARLEGERQKIVEETADKKAALVREEALANEEFARGLADIERQLDSLSPSASVRADAAANEIEERFRETREKLEAEVRAGSRTAEEALERLNKLVGGLGARAKFDVLSRGVDAKLGELRDLEELLSVGVSTGQIKAKDAAKRRLELEREYKRALLDSIEGLAEIARRTGDPELAAQVRKLQIEWAKLGNVIDETAKRIDDTLRGGLEDTLVSILTRTESVGSAFRKLAQTILAEIARILAANFVEKLFGGILNTNAQGTSLGGILAKILGASTPKPSSTPSAPGSGIENIPLIIKNFAGSVSQGFSTSRNSTEGLRGDVRAGVGQVNSNLGTAIDLLGNIASSSLAQTAAGIAAAGTAIFKILTAGGGADRATGGFESAAPGGRLIRVAEAGYDEVVMTTDPRHRGRTSRLLGEFLRRTGLAPDFGSVVLEGALAGVPSFAAGGFALADISPPETVGGDNISVNVDMPIYARDLASFRGSEQAIKRDAARAVNDGIRRAKSRPR